MCLLEFKLLVLLLQLVDFLLQGGHCSLDWFGFKVRILYYRNRGWDIDLLTNTVKWSGCHPVLGLSCFFVFELRWQMTSLNHVFKLLVSQIFGIDLGRNNRRFDLGYARHGCFLFCVISLRLVWHSFGHVDVFLRLVLAKVTSRRPVGNRLLTLKISLIFFKMRVLWLDALDFKFDCCKV